MADEVDRASEREQMVREAALQEVRAKLQEGDWQERSLKWCSVCGERIPDARRRAVVGTGCCASCQAEIETGDRRTRGW